RVRLLEQRLGPLAPAPTEKRAARIDERPHGPGWVDAVVRSVGELLGHGKRVWLVSQHRAVRALPCWSVQRARLVQASGEAERLRQRARCRPPLLPAAVAYLYINNPLALHLFGRTRCCIVDEPLCPQARVRTRHYALLAIALECPEGTEAAARRPAAVP